MGRDKSVSGNPIAPVPSPSLTQPKDQLVIPRLWAGPTRYQGSRCRSLCPPLQRDLHGEICTFTEYKLRSPCPLHLTKSCRFSTNSAMVTCIRSIALAHAEHVHQSISEKYPSLFRLSCHGRSTPTVCSTDRPTYRPTVCPDRLLVNR